ncbi:heavy-metal-associated domain-containing protein [Frankia sp. ACN1ag]|uniref:heavy-metal-associated domain-containing protein n=1 Tax=Frankia sp. ACN1ag TaxID=102891 RepID=UPI00128F66E8|nr:heavy-metal-associated domain-containing protein [Frankia sp. ACN1ag]
MATRTSTVTGMTCGHCVSAGSGEVGGIDGVSATVNDATETAAVRYDPAILGPQDLVATVEAAGCTARLPQPPTSDTAPAAGQPDDGAHASNSLRLRRFHPADLHPANRL